MPDRGPDLDLDLDPSAGASPVRVSDGQAAERPDIAVLQEQIRLLQAELDLLVPADAALARAERRTAAMQTLIERQSRRIVELQAARAAQERQMAELHRSLSWRFTAPLRALRAWMQPPR